MTQGCVSRKVGSLLIGLFLSVLSHESGAQEKCEGENVQVHDHGDEHFATTSRVYPGNGVETYETCVENRGNKDLFIHWFVPGPHSYVRPGEAVKSPRSLLTRESKEYRGCMEYGSVGTYMREPFIGHVSDGPLIESEEGGCDKVNPLAENAAATSTILSIEVPIKIYFPSDSKEPESTMLRLEGVARTGTEASKLFTTLAYTVQHASEAQKGNATEVHIRPFIAGDFYQKYFLEAFHKRFGERLSLKEGDEINISFYDASYDKLFSLDTVRYGVFDSDDRLVAAFFAPIWRPGS